MYFRTPDLQPLQPHSPTQLFFTLHQNAIQGQQDGTYAIRRDGEPIPNNLVEPQLLQSTRIITRVTQAFKGQTGGQATAYAITGSDKTEDKTILHLPPIPKLDPILQAQSATTTSQQLPVTGPNSCEK